MKFLPIRIENVVINLPDYILIILLYSSWVHKNLSQSKKRGENNRGFQQGESREREYI